MKIRNTITKFIRMTIAVAAMAVIGSIGMPGRAAGANAQTAPGDGSVRFVSKSIGFIPGQTLRFSVANLSAREEGIGSVHVQAYIYDSYGNLLSQTGPVEVPAERFSILDFKRDDLLVAGEARTRRLQVRGEIICRYSNSSEPISPDRLLVSLEGFNTAGGGDYFTGTVTVSDDGFGG